MSSSWIHSNDSAVLRELAVSIWIICCVFYVGGSSTSDENQVKHSLEVVLPRENSVWVANGRQRKIMFKYDGGDVDVWKIKLIRDDGRIVKEFEREVLFPFSQSSSSSLQSSAASSFESSSSSSSLLQSSSAASSFESSLSSSLPSSAAASSCESSSSFSSLLPLSASSASSSSVSLPVTSTSSTVTNCKSSTTSTYEKLVLVEPNILSGKYHIEICANSPKSKSNSKELCSESPIFYIESAATVGQGNQAQQTPQHETRFYNRQTKLEEMLSTVNLEALWPVNDTKCTVHRIYRPNKKQFIEECMGPGRPCMITGMMGNWTAMHAWTFESFQDDPRIKEGIYVGQHQEMIPLKVYYDYVKNLSQRDEKKWMVFMPDVFEMYPELLKDYSIPDFFSSDDDFMDGLDDDLRLDWRWIIMAPKYSGSGWHVDPANTTGWLALVSGAKLWGFYPPSEYQIPGVKNNYYQKRDYDMDDAFNWWTYTRPYMNSNTPIECVQKPGDIAFIPNGWWHSVVNLEHTVAVTQNFCNHYSFKACLRELKTQSDSNGLFIGRTFEQLRDLYMEDYPDYFEDEDKKFTAPEEGIGKTLDQEKQKRMEDLKRYLSGVRS